MSPNTNHQKQRLPHLKINKITINGINEEKSSSVVVGDPDSKTSVTWGKTNQHDDNDNDGNAAARSMIMSVSQPLDYRFSLCWDAVIVVTTTPSSSKEISSSMTTTDDDNVNGGGGGGGVYSHKIYWRIEFVVDVMYTNSAILLGETNVMDVPEGDNTTASFNFETTTCEKMISSGYDDATLANVGILRLTALAKKQQDNGMEEDVDVGVCNLVVEVTNSNNSGKDGLIRTIYSPFR